MFENRLLCLFLCAVAVSTNAAAALDAVPAWRWDPGFTAANEQYLEPFLADLAEYRQTTVGKELINLANLVDILPTWLEDLLVLPAI